MTLPAAVDRYVTPGRRYLKLLGGYNVGDIDYAGHVQFGRAMAEDARRVTDAELDELFNFDWRSRLTAGWLAGLTRRERHRDRVGELLLASELVYQGQGLIFALTRFGTPQDAQLLADYLHRYLPRHDLMYQQDWAMGALLHVDARLGTDYADQFLGDGGAWQQWVAVRLPDRADPDYHRQHIDRQCDIADVWMR